MIRFTLRVRNLWGRDLPHHDYFYYHKQLSKNKSFETQVYRGSFYDFFNLVVDLSWTGEDHAGPELVLEIGKYSVNIKIYDHRHWDYKKGTWEVHNESEEE
jgi:hypothetical protein